jgi:HEAT repeat protein
MKSRTFLLIGGSIVGTLLLGVVALCAWGIDGGGELSVAAMIRRLEDHAATHRRDAAAALGQVVGPGANRAASGLIKALGDSDTEVRARSARSLGSLLAANPIRPRLEEAESALAATLRDPVMTVRMAAAAGLQSLGRETDDAFAIAIEALRGDDSSLQAESSVFLTSLAIRDANTLRRFLRLIDDPSAIVRQVTRDALIRRVPPLSAELASEVLAPAVRDGSPTVREVAASMLGRSVARTPAGRDLLMTALNDPTPTVRLAASAAMGAYAEDPLARFALQLAADDPDLRVRATASASLAVGRHATRAEALADLKIATKHDPAHSGLATLIEINPARAAPYLLVALRAPNSRLRAAAARCLGEVVPLTGKTSPVVDALIQALADRDPSVRRASAAALARYGSDAANALDALKRAARDIDRSVSGQAFLTLRGLEEMRVR